MPLLHFLLPLLLLASQALMAQEQSARERTCRILFLLAPAGAPETLQLFDGQSSREVALPRMNFSPPYALPAGPLKLHLLPSAVAAPEEVPAGAPSVEIPVSMQDCYLLISADPANKVAPVRVQAVDAGTDKFQIGDILWFNLTPNLVAGEVGTRKLNLKPKARLILDAPATGKESYLVNLAYRIPDDARTYPLCETSWLHDPRARKVAFIFTEKDRRAPRVLAFSDYRPPKQNETP